MESNSNALEILHNKFITGNPQREAALADERATDHVTWHEPHPDSKRIISIFASLRHEMEYLKRSISYQEITTLDAQVRASLDAVLEEKGYHADLMQCSVSEREWMVIRKAVKDAA